LFHEKYAISEVIGTGAFGEVSIATCTTTGEKLAVKQVQTEKKDVLAMFQNEFDIAKRLQHRNIVKVYDMFVNDATCYLVMDLCTGGDLVQYIESHEDHDCKGQEVYCPPSADTLASLLSQMLQSICYLHHYKIVHRDIKLENFLFAREGESRPEVKLIDFGFAAMLKPGQVLRDCIGTAGYIAPEVFTDSGYGLPCDAWSMGVCVYLLFTGFFPIPDVDKTIDKEVMRRLTEENEIQFESPEFKIPHQGMDMLKKLLQKDASARSTPKEILKSDSWLRSQGRGKANGCCVVS
jgi:serine/threonine protein kinase